MESHKVLRSFQSDPANSFEILFLIMITAILFSHFFNFIFLSWLFYSRQSLGSTVLLQVVDNIRENGTLLTLLTVVAMQPYEAVKPKRLRQSRIVTTCY